MNFKRDKNGYNEKEVDAYIGKMVSEFSNTANLQKIRISELKRENDILKNELCKYKQKNDSINDALIVAVETAKQIENSSKNVYDLEIKRIRSLYRKWELFLNDTMRKYPDSKKDFNAEKLLKEFNEKIEEVVSDNSTEIAKKSTTQKEKVKDNVQSNVGLRSLIAKMGGNTFIPVERPTITIKRNDTVKNSKTEKEPVKKMTKTQKVENDFEESEKTNFKSKIKPISNMKIDENSKFDDLVDKFLNEGDGVENNNAYSKALMRKKEKENGFDLKEALNPTEDLAEIMKGFDFFDEDDGSDE